MRIRPALTSIAISQQLMVQTPIRSAGDAMGHGRGIDDGRIAREGLPAGLTAPRPEGIMMLVRTTLTLDDDLLRLARRRASDLDRPLKDVINDALRDGLTLGEPRHGRPYRFRLKTVAGSTQPGVDLTDRDKLFELMER